MKTNRRKFLSLLGVGAAASPLAAKAALDEAIAKQAGINVAALASGFPGTPAASAPTSEAGQTAIYQNWLPYPERVQKAAAWVKVMGHPDFLEKSMRQNSQWVGALDPDIAAKRSWSMSVKIQEQRARNYERIKQEYQDQASYYIKKSAVEKLLGFEWPW